MNQKIKISQLPAKGSNLAAADLLEIAEFTGTGYISKSITGAEIAAGATAGFVPETRTLTINGTTQDLSADRTFTISTGITIGTTAITSGTVGRVLFEGTGNVVQESANLFWDNTNGRLGIGTSSPANTIDLIGTRIRHNGTASATAVSTIYELNDTSSANKSYLLFGIDTTGGVVGTGISGTYISGGRENLGASRDINIHNYLPSHINFWTNNTQRLRIFGSTGNIGINTTTDAGFRLDVNGTARVSGQLTVTGNIVGTALLTASQNQTFVFFQRRTTVSGDAFTIDDANIGGGSSINVNVLNLAGSWQTTGTCVHNNITITRAINLASGTQTVRGFYYNPTLTNTTGLTTHYAIHTAVGRIRFENLPTSSAGLATGEIWNDAGTLKIV